MKPSYDVVIIGGGLVGMSLALLLAPHVASIALVEAGPLSPTQNTVTLGKALALAAPHLDTLMQMGVWTALCAEALPVKTVHISEAGRFGAVRLTAEAEHLTALAYMIDESALKKALRERLLASTVTCYQPAKVIAWHEASRTLILQSGASLPMEISAHWVVAADGANSTLRGLAGMAVDETDYQQMALVTRLQISGHHQQTAYERFTPFGTLAFMPQLDGCVALIITADHALIQDWQALSEADFLARAEALIGSRLGRLLARGEMLSYPLKRLLAREQARPGLILLGNAAHSVHPVAAQGFNLGLREAALLASLFEKAAIDKKDDAQIAETYIAAATAIQKPVMLMTDSIVRYFSKQTVATKALRYAGLLSFSYCDFLRRQLCRIGLGN